MSFFFFRWDHSLSARNSKEEKRTHLGQEPRPRAEEDEEQQQEQQQQQQQPGRKYGLKQQRERAGKTACFFLKGEEVEERESGLEPSEKKE